MGRALSAWMISVVVLACGGAGGGGADAPDAGDDAPAAVEVAEILPDAVAEVGEAVVPDTPWADAVIPATLGGDRPAALHVPAGYDPATPIPLVMLLHGYGVNGALQSAYLGLPARADALGFALIVPDGTVDSQGLRFWNAGSSCCNFDGTDVDDVAYLGALLAEAKQVLNIDARRVTLIGHSNGGFMAHRMACDASDVVTGIASIAGSMTVDATCTPAHPVSVLLLHGTADADIGFDGGSILGFDYLPAEDLVDLWVTSNGCAEPATIEPEPVDYDQQVPGAETTRTSWTGCAAGTRVDFWKMQGSGHIPPFSTAAKDALLQRLLGL